MLGLKNSVNGKMEKKVIIVTTLLFDCDMYLVLFMPSPKGLVSDLCSKNVAVVTPTLPK